MLMNPTVRKAPALADVVISVKNVSHAYAQGAVKTLNDVSLDIGRGEMVCLIGPSGCGKSTLLNIIGGLVAPSTGEVLVDGKAINGPSPKSIGFVFQENTLFPWSTIVENVVTALEFQGVPKAERLGRAQAALDNVGLADFRNSYPHQLSGGMKQRASLARALALETDVILMDEPFAALDEQTRTYLGEELSYLLADTKKTIVMVTHSLGEAVFLSDRVVVMTARPAAIKSIIEVDYPHPRDPDFMMSPHFSELRNEIYALLRDEIRQTVGGLVGRAAGRDRSKGDRPVRVVE